MDDKIVAMVTTCLSRNSSIGKSHIDVCNIKGYHFEVKDEQLLFATVQLKLYIHTGWVCIAFFGLKMGN